MTKAGNKKSEAIYKSNYEHGIFKATRFKQYYTVFFTRKILRRNVMAGGIIYVLNWKKKFIVNKIHALQLTVEETKTQKAEFVSYVFHNLCQLQKKKRCFSLLCRPFDSNFKLRTISTMGLGIPNQNTA